MTDETTLLGAILQDPRTLDGVADILSVGDFGDDDNAATYETLRKLAERGASIDIPALMAELRKTHPEVGAQKIGAMIAGVPHMDSVQPLAMRVLDASRRRKAIVSAQTLSGRLRDPGQDLEEALDDHLRAVSAIMESGRIAHTHRLGGVLKDALADLDTYASASYGLTGIPSGLVDLDSLTSGWQKGTLIIVAARPRCGKSVLLAQCARFASERGHKVLAFTLEMTPRAITQRMLISVAEVDKRDLRNEVRAPAAWSRIAGATEHLKPLPLWLNSWEQPNLSQIRSAARRLQSRDGLDLIVVDYLQRCKVDSGLERWRAIGELAQGLKSLALSLDVPVLCAAQLNREAEKAKPSLAHLREAGDIEQEADIVAFLNPQGESEDQEPEVDLIVEKHRQGEQRTVPLRFQKRYSRFVNVAR